jgi:transposase
MPATTKVSLRPLTPEEQAALERLVHSRTEPARLVERARILSAAAQGQRPAAIAAQVGVSRETVYNRMHRFNDRGLAGLGDLPRSGRPHTYTAGQRAEVIAAALTDPKRLGLPFGCWTLDRLRAYLNAQKGIGIKRSRIGEILVDEGLKWRHQETWFGERVDPDFAEKRGRSRSFTPRRRRAAPSSASTRWGRRRPRATPAKSPSAPSRGMKPTATAAPPGAASRRSTTAAVARGMSSAPSGRRPARP